MQLPQNNFFFMKKKFMENRTIMSKLISTRLSEEEIQELNDVAKLENIDRSTLIRKILTEKVKEIRMKKMGELYHNGTISMQEAATAAKVSVYEMMDYLHRNQIRPIEETPEEMESHFEYAQNILKDLKK